MQAAVDQLFDRCYFDKDKNGMFFLIAGGSGPVPGQPRCLHAALPVGFGVRQRADGRGVWIVICIDNDNKCCI